MIKYRGEREGGANVAILFFVVDFFLRSTRGGFLFWFLFINSFLPFFLFDMVFCSFLVVFFLGAAHVLSS